MFGWLLDWLLPYRRRRKLREQLLFSFYDGTRIRWVDPYHVEDVLSRHLGREWAAKVVESRTPPPAALIGQPRVDREDALTELRAKVRRAVDEAFGVEDYRETPEGHRGLMQPEKDALVDLYSAHCLFLQELARPKADGSPPDSPPPAS